MERGTALAVSGKASTRHLLGFGIALAVFFLFLQPVLGVHYFIDDVLTSRAGMRIQCTDRGMMNALGFYGVRCCRLVDRILGSAEGRGRRIWILEDVEGGEKGETNGDTIVVSYRVGDSELRFAHALFEALVRRRLEHAFRSPVQSRPFFHVVVSGLTHRYVRGRHALSGYYEPDYSIARDQFMRQDYPRIEELLKTSIPMEHRFFHELYMLHSDLLVLALEGVPRGRHGAVVFNMLKAEQRGQDIMKAYVQQTKSHWRTGENGQTFYQRMVYRVSRRRGRLSGEDVIAERVKELETVSVLGYEGGTALRRVPLESMPDVLENYRTDVAGVFRLEERFRSLCQASPYLLRPSLNQYIVALSRIRQGDIKGFKEEIVQARNAFQRAMSRQRSMNRFISRYEQEHIPALHRYVDYVDVIMHYRSLADTLYPKDVFKRPKTGISTAVEGKVTP